MVLNSSDKLNFIVFSGGVGSISGNKTTTAVYRDPSAWYHIVFVFNTTSATAEDRMQIWVNGVRVTAWDTNTLISQNFAGYINNSTYVHELGALYYTPNTNFVDGFYLPFTNTTSTTTLGNDFSGNGNNWTTNNISLTPGATYDAMTDVPTLTSATAANYPVLNPLSIYVVSPTDGNLAFSGTSAGGIGSMGATSGKYYWETVYTAIGSGDGVLVGVRSAESIATNAAENVGYYGGGTENGKKTINGGAASAYGATWTTGDVIGVALDIDGGSITFYKNNVSQGAISYTFTGKSWVSFNWRTGSAGTNTGSINFGQRPFAYTPPSGFVALNTFNLPSSTIPAGNKFMDVVLRNGGAPSGGTYSTTINMANGALLWDKPRNQVGSNYLIDSVRGISQLLSSDQTAAETSLASWFTAFNNGSFTTGGSDWGSSVSLVDWIWAAGGTGVTNTSGTITSTVSANTTSGFSVVTYTGTGANATVGHGLNVTPSMVIVKRRDSSTNGDWFTYTAMTGNANALYLNLTNASAASGGAWNNTSPTSSVFTVGTSTGVNASASTYVAYCFAPIAGFSAIGSYTGNGSTDGPFIYTGFRPRWIMIKSSSAVGNWIVFDSSRLGYNGANDYLLPNSSLGEGTDVDIDILSNGFKPRDSAGPTNVSGTTYVYACFAENPFKNALAR